MDNDQYIQPLLYVHKVMYRNALSKASIRWETSAKEKSETQNLAVLIGLFIIIHLNFVNGLDLILRSHDGYNDNNPSEFQ